MEEWRNGGMEEWRNGGMEELTSGQVDKRITGQTYEWMKRKQKTESEKDKFVQTKMCLKEGTKIELQREICQILSDLHIC